MRLQFFSADWTSLKTIASVVSRELQFRNLTVLSHTVAKVDSIGLDVRLYIRCSAEKS